MRWINLPHRSSQPKSVEEKVVGIESVCSPVVSDKSVRHSVSPAAEDEEGGAEPAFEEEAGKALMAGGVNNVGGLEVEHVDVEGGDEEEEEGGEDEGEVVYEQDEEWPGSVADLFKLNPLTQVWGWAWEVQSDDGESDDEIDLTWLDADTGAVDEEARDIQSDEVDYPV